MITDARIERELSEAEYRPVDAWSISQLKLLPKKPELFYGFHVARPPLWEFEESSDMLFGTVCHAEFLEGKTCTEIPAEVLTSNGQRRGKAWEQYRDSHTAIECLSRKEAEAVRLIRASCDAQPRIANLLWGDGDSELAVFGRDEETGLGVKGKIDKLRLTPDGPIIVDLKITSIDPDDERQVGAKVFEFSYHQQAAFYWDLYAAATLPPMGFIFVFCRNKPPYTVRAWQPNDNDLELGRRRNRLALCDLRRRLDSGDWTGERHNRINYGADGMLLPKWAYTNDAADNPPPAGGYEEFMAFAATYQNQGENQ